MLELIGAPEPEMTKEMRAWMDWAYMNLSIGQIRERFRRSQLKSKYEQVMQPNPWQPKMWQEDFPRKA